MDTTKTGEIDEAELNQIMNTLKTVYDYTPDSKKFTQITDKSIIDESNYTSIIRKFYNETLSIERQSAKLRISGINVKFGFTVLKDDIQIIVVGVSTQNPNEQVVIKLSSFNNGKITLARSMIDNICSSWALVHNIILDITGVDFSYSSKSAISAILGELSIHSKNIICDRHTQNDLISQHNRKE